jgi:hypothetical protein
MNVRPWLLEVNISPSLACDSPLDFLLKSNLLSETLNLACIYICNGNHDLNTSQMKNINTRAGQQNPIEEYHRELFLRLKVRIICLVTNNRKLSQEQEKYYEIL